MSSSVGDGSHNSVESSASVLMSLLAADCLIAPHGCNTWPLTISHVWPPMATTCFSLRTLLSHLGFSSGYIASAQTQGRTGETRGDAGSNTSTVTLWIVGRDEKGSLESETVKYGHESYRTLTWKWLHWRGPVVMANDRPILSSERAPQINKPATVRQ
jgi:hypothetical protein